MEWYTDGVAVLLGADSVVVVACISAVAAVCGVAVLVESTSNGVVAALCVVGVIVCVACVVARSYVVWYASCAVVAWLCF